MRWLECTNRDLDEMDEAGWEVAWHGCKVEAVYSICVAGKLLESRDEEAGERYLEGAPGVYLHREKTAAKADNYIGFTPLADDGVYWATKWETRVDRERKVKVPRKTDQWAQREEAVRLVALWVASKNLLQIKEGYCFEDSWIPRHEANPWNPRPRGI